MRAPIRDLDRMTVTDWDRILDRVYEAALHPEKWAELLLAIGKPLKAHGGQLVVMASDALHFHENLFAGIDSERGSREFAELVESGQHTRAIAVKSLPELTTISDYAHTTEGQMRADPFYQDHAIPLGVAYYGASILKKHDETFIASAVFRCKRYGNLNSREIAYLDRLAPHLRRSMNLSLQLPVDGVIEGVMSALEKMSCGAIVVDQRASIVAMNTRAQRITTEADGVTDAAGLICVTDKLADRAIRQEIAVSIGVRSSAKAVGNGCVVVKRPSGRTSYNLVISPISWRQGPFLSSRHALILVIDPEGNTPLSPTVLSSTFDLTPAESGVAGLLASGLSLEQIAQRRSTTAGTIRSQLKRIFLKTGCRHQAELVSKLNSIQSIVVTTAD